MTTEPPQGSGAVRLRHRDVFPGSEDDSLYFEFDVADAPPVTFFMGANGSGKSRTARAIAKAAQAEHLSTDRLMGIMTVDNYGWGAIPRPHGSHGVPLGKDNRESIRQISREWGIGTESVLSLRDEPEVMLRVAAFLRRALGRHIELREVDGYLDPAMRVAGVEYSLLSDEGHGLRELVVLLATIYRSSWSLVVIDEPELHMHPALVKLWLGELKRECLNGRRAIIVTHDPGVVSGASIEMLDTVWWFGAGRRPVLVGATIETTNRPAVAGGLRANDQLVGDLVFAPRPVLVEGPSDAVALRTAAARTLPAESYAQTQFVPCEGLPNVAAWLEISWAIGIDVRAVVDLDAVFNSRFQAAMDNNSAVAAAYEHEFMPTVAKTFHVIRPFIEAADRAGVSKNVRERASWLATAKLTQAQEIRRDRLLKIWEENGVWVHRGGTLENVLGVPEAEKSVEAAREAAGKPGALDQVARWAAYDLDLRGDLLEVLGAAVEATVQRAQNLLRTSPELEFSRAPGPAGGLVSLAPVGSSGKLRVTVERPVAFAGYWLEFDRATAPSELKLLPPTPSVP